MKLAKKPLSEGFDLWDRGYYLGAMRLFIFKGETLPPFQLGPCLDAMGHLLARIEEASDAKDNFHFAAEKYELIQQPVLQQVMLAKAVEVTQGPEAALAIVKPFVTSLHVTPDIDDRAKGGIARAYHYYAELLVATASQPDHLSEALHYANEAFTLKFDRSFLALLTIGQIQEQQGNPDAARAAYEQVRVVNPNSLQAIDRLIDIVRSSPVIDPNYLILLYRKAIELHPKTQFITDLSFFMAEHGQSVEAIQTLDHFIANPPHEETEAFMFGGQAVGNLLKAKSALLADIDGRLGEALAAAQEALKHTPDDEGLKKMIAEISAMQSS